MFDFVTISLNVSMGVDQNAPTRFSRTDVLFQLEDFVKYISIPLFCRVQLHATSGRTHTLTIQLSKYPNFSVGIFSNK